MLGWLMIGAATLAMYRIAEAENRSGLAWGGLTFGVCLACAMTIPLPMLNIGIGFLLVFAAMFVAKVIASR